MTPAQFWRDTSRSVSRLGLPVKERAGGTAASPVKGGRDGEEAEESNTWGEAKRAEAVQTAEKKAEGIICQCVSISDGGE